MRGRHGVLRYAQTRIAPQRMPKTPRGPQRILADESYHRGMHVFLPKRSGSRRRAPRLPPRTPQRARIDQGGGGNASDHARKPQTLLKRSYLGLSMAGVNRSVRGHLPAGAAAQTPSIRTSTPVTAWPIPAPGPRGRAAPRLPVRTGSARNAAMDMALRPAGMMRPQTIAEGPVAGAVPADQPLFHKQIEDAVERDLVDPVLPAHAVEDVGGGQGLAGLVQHPDHQQPQGCRLDADVGKQHPPRLRAASYMMPAPYAPRRRQTTPRPRDRKKTVAATAIMAAPEVRSNR